MEHSNTVQALQALQAVFTAFKATSIWASMMATVEDSPWHREANVAVHTEMIVREYLRNFASDRTEQEIKLALLSILFHDAGKPSAEEVLDKKDGTGQYRRYAGHEQDSAVTFTECYLKMPELRALLTDREARAIRWTIEHHLPYGMTDKLKRRGLRAATRAAYQEAGVTDRTFFDVLRSDCWGRISDDHGTKKAAVEDWINTFRQIEVPEYHDTMSETSRTMMILIGASGSGKSTFRAMYTDSAVISADEMKVAFYREAKGVAFTMPASDPEVYAAAWQYCTMDPEGSKAFDKHFKAEALRIVKQAAANGGRVLVDMVNSSKKKRAPFVEMAKQHKMCVIAVEFWNSFDTLSARQKTRGDKCVPDSSIKQQLYATTCAWLGHEVHHVIMRVGT
jgi:predicted kinase